MPFHIRLFLTLSLALITFLVLSSGPAYAEWVSVSSSKDLDGYTAYLDPDTIRRKGHLVNVWGLYDFKTIQTVAGRSHLSVKTQHEYDCSEERSRSLASKFFSGSMGMGNVVRTVSYESTWEPVTPESIYQDLLKIVCGKGQSSGRAPASPPINTSFDDLQTLQTQAAQGNARAQYNLGVMYAMGLGVPQDSREALKWFHLSAAQGNAGAQYNLGVMYANGYGVPQDSRESLKWFRLAAAQGDAGGQYTFGVMYLNGQGVPQDSREAATWFRLAAAQGHVKAQNNLGVMYAMGQGVPKDYVRAYMWWSLSAAHSTGDEQKLAAENRDEIAGRMTPAQIADAQKLAQEWKPKTP